MGFQEASGISENRLNSQALPARPLPSRFSCEVLTVTLTYVTMSNLKRHLKKVIFITVSVTKCVIPNSSCVRYTFFHLDT